MCFILFFCKNGYQQISINKAAGQAFKNQHVYDLFVSRLEPDDVIYEVVSLEHYPNVQKCSL